MAIEECGFSALCVGRRFGKKTGGGGEEGQTKEHFLVG